MMKHTSTYPTEALFKGLRTLLTSLPSEEEKAELVQTLRETRDFLDELELLVESFPTTESSQSLSQGLSRLDILADRAVSDAPLRRVMGLRGSQGSRAKSINGVEEVKSRAQRLEHSIIESESSDIVGLMKRSGEPISVLTELAASLGLRTRSKERKADLIKRIATHVTNQRGYRLLREGDSDSIVHMSASSTSAQN